MVIHSNIDPIFFLVRGKVDKIWYNWWLLHPQATDYDYPFGPSVEYLDMLELVPFRLTFSDVMNTTFGHNLLCYKHLV
jgi:hypothetical protein